MEELVREGCQVIEIDKASHRAVAPSDIRINTACGTEIMENTEIRLAIEKRFNGKRTLYADPGFKELVAWCLCTDSYKMCEKNVQRVSDADIELAWQFIDTASVSSTRPCREMVLRYKSGRSAVGFRREHVTQQPTPVRHRPLTRRGALSTVVPYTNVDSQGYRALEDILVEDCMKWVLESPDPTSSTLLLRSRLLQRDQ